MRAWRGPRPHKHRVRPRRARRPHTHVCRRFTVGHDRPVEQLAGHVAGMVLRCACCGSYSYRDLRRAPARRVFASSGPLGLLLEMSLILLAALPAGPSPRFSLPRPRAPRLSFDQWRRRYPPIKGGAAITAAAAGGSWSATGTWVGGVVPTSADDVLLAATSGTVTIDVAASCKTLDCTGYTHTLNHNAGLTLTVAGLTFKLVSTMVYNRSANTSALAFTASTGTVAITCGGLSLGNTTLASGVNNSTAVYQFQDANTVASTATLTLNSGTLDTNGKACSWGLFATSNANTRTFTPGASAITLTGTGTVWNTATITGLTVTANTATLTASGAAATFSSAGKNWNGMSASFTGSGTATVSSGSTFANFTRTGTAVKTDALTWGVVSSQTTTITGTLTLTGNSLTNVLLVQTGTLGTAATLTAAAVSLTNVDFMDITGAGAASWTGTRLGDCGGNSAITFPAGLSRFLVATGNASSTGVWASGSGGATGASVPLPQDSVTLNAASGVVTLTLDMPRTGKDWACTGFTGTVNNTASGVTTFGNLTLAAGMTLAGGQAWVLGGRGAQTLTSNGKSFSSALTISAPAGTYTLQDALTIPAASNFTLTDGTIDGNGQNASIGVFVSNSGRTRVAKLGTGTWTLKVTSSNAWLVTAAGLTLTPSTSTIVISDTGASSKTFAGGGMTYNNFSITGGGAGAVILSGSNTFNNVTLGAPKTVQVTAGTSQTVTTFTATGSSGNVITLQSTAGGTAWNLLCASGVISCDWLSLQDSHASGGATFYAGQHSTNVSGNTGWSFSSAPVLAQDSWAVSDSATATVARPRASADSVTLSDAVAGRVVVSRGAQDTWAASDASSAVLARFPQATDSWTLTDGAARIASVARGAADAFAAVDSAVVTVAGARAAADALNVADAASGRVTVARNASDAIAAVDAATVRMAVLAVAQDVFTVLDGVDVRWQGSRAAQDVLAVLDTAGVIGAYTRAAHDSLGVSDAASAVVVRAVFDASDAVAVADAASAVAGHRLTAADGWSIAELATVRAALHVAAADVVAVVDAAGRVVAAQLIASDVFTVSDTTVVVLRLRMPGVVTGFSLSAIRPGRVPQPPGVTTGIPLSEIRSGRAARTRQM